MKRILLLSALLIYSYLGFAALNPGDIAFVQYNADGTDNFAFVALVNIPAGEEIKFTDNGWFSTNSFRTGEGTMTWTAPAGGVSAGTVVTISATPSASLGTITAFSPSISADGDQLLAYQGLDTAPVFITAINNEGAAAWQTTATNTNDSGLPNGLTNGTNAVAIAEIDNAVYNGITTGTKAALLAALMNKDNWTGSNSVNQTFSGTFSIEVASLNLSINDFSLSEGNSGTADFNFTVSLSAPAGPGGVTFDIATTDNTATTGNNDYTLKSLTSQTIPTGSDSYTFTVKVNGDISVEANETFFVNISGVSGATLLDGQGQGTIMNDDVASVIITESDGSTNVTEGGATDTYSVVLTSQPTSNVTVIITVGTQVTTIPSSSLTFTPINWNVPQGVTVSAVDDIDIEGNHSENITHSISSSDPNYNGLSIANVMVNITDNDAITPTFTQLGPYCAGDEPGALPTTSNNGIVGIWNPSTINTSNANSTLYTFMPNSGQNASVATMTVLVKAPTPSPVFVNDANCTTANGEVCVGTKLSFSVDANASSNLPNGSVIEWVEDTNNDGDVYDEAGSAVLATQTVGTSMGNVAEDCTTLSAGDIAIIDIQSDSPDRFSFIALTNIKNGTQIIFTDAGFISASTSFYGTENGYITWTAPISGITAGTIVTIEIPVAPGTLINVNTGTVSYSEVGGGNDFSLSASGDQIIAYCGTPGDASTAIFLSAVTTYATIWDYNETTEQSNSSDLPTGLTNGVNALAVGVSATNGQEYDNALWSCDGSSISNSQSQVLSQIYTLANWTRNDNTISLPPSCSVTVTGLTQTEIFTLTPNCAEYQVTDSRCNTTLRIKPRISPVNNTCYDGNNKPTLATKSYSVICPTASVSAASSSPVCIGADAVFNISGSANSVVTYNIGNGPVEVGLNAQGSASVTTSTANGNVTLTLEKVVQNACTTILDGSATVTTELCCNAVLATIDNEICVGESTTLTITVSNGTGNYTISIDDGDANTPLYTNNNYVSGTPIEVTPSINTTYSIVLVSDNGDDAEVCSKIGTPSISVLPLPDAPNVSDIKACLGESTNIAVGKTAGSITATYDFENTAARRAGVAGGTGASSVTVSDLVIGSGLDQMEDYFGGTAPTATSAFATDQWTTNESIDLNDYLEFCISANPGCVLDLTNFRFDARRSGSGVMKYMLALSVNGGAFNYIGAEGTLSESFAAKTEPLTLSGAENVCIRLYGYSSDATSGNLRIDNVVFSGTVRPAIQYHFYTEDPALNESAIPIATGSSYDPAPAVGTTTEVWVTCVNQSGCEGPATKVSVTVTECEAEIIDPCVCQNNAPVITNGTYSNAGTFKDLVVVNSPSGMTWTVKTVSGLYNDADGTDAVEADDVLVETSPGVYELPGFHMDSVGYSIVVVNGRGTELSSGNTCYYPDPSFAGLPLLIAPTAAPFQITGTVANGATGVGTFSLNGIPQAGASPAPTTLTINPATLPLGENTVTYSFDADTAGSKTLSDPGCVKTVRQSFRVAHCGCQDLTVSLDANCQFKLTADVISDGNCNGATVRVMDNDPSNGDTIDCTGVWTYGLFDSFGNIICWGKVTAEDKSAPIFVCANWYQGTLDCYDVDFVLNNRQTIGNVGATSSPRPAVTSTQTINNAEGVNAAGKVVDTCAVLVPPSLVADNINNLGYTYFKDNCYNCGCRTNLKWSDRVVFYNCDQMKANGGIYARIYRTWVATDCKGMSRDTVQEIPFARPAIEDFVFSSDGDGGKYDQVVEYSSCVPDKELIQKSDYLPFVCSYFNRTAAPRFSRCLYLDEVECNYSVSFKDTEFPICGGKGLKIDREVYVFDWCAGGIVDTFHVLIKFGDFTAPYLEYAPKAPFDISTGPMDCTAAFPISAAGIKSAFGVDIKDDCSLGNISVKLKTKDRYVKGILVAEDTWDEVSYTIMNGMMLGVPVGRHRMIIDAFDGCYNAKKDSFEFEVKDKIAPVMKCDDDLHVTLSNANGYTNGYAQVSAADIDEGSWDNCKMAWIAVRRNVPDACAASFIQKGYDTNGNGKLDALPADNDYSKADGFDRNGDGDIEDFGETFILKGGKLMTPLLDYVEFFCCDLTERVTVELWGGDIYGNTNYCWMDLLIEDKVAPTCLAPWDVTIYCDDKNIAQIDDKIASGKIFGDVTIPTGNDCAALDTTYTTEKKLKCGAGYIDRIWTLTKQTVKGPISVTCKQRIHILPVHEYNICFPKDVSTDCKTPIIDTVITDELGCDILAVNVHDKRYDASDDECYKIFRTYSVINWCTYDDRCGDPLEQTNIAIIDRSFFENYGKNPIYMLVRDNDRDGDEEFYISENLTPNEAKDYHFFGDEDRNGSASGSGYNSTFSGYAPYCPVAKEYYHSFIYTQIIKVYDETRPVVTGTRDTFCTSPTACTANITKLVTLKDNCTDKVELETQFLMIAPFQTLEAGKMILYSTPRWSTKDLGNGQFEITVSNLPEGTHDLIVVGRDECGNLSVPTRIPFVVKDCKAPAPICINGLSVDLMPDGNGGGMMTVWATDFVASKIYDCNGQGPETKDGLKLITKYSVNRVLEPVNPNQTSISVNCADLELGFILVELHAWDEAGNHDFCVTFVEVQDNRKVCPTPADKVKIAGTIATEGSGNLQGVSVTLSGSGTQSDMTGTDGNYEFVNISKGGDFTVTPQLDKNHLNGVSTFDLVLIQKHILGVQALNSPYKMIAADANNSKSISTLDLIQIRKLILNIDTHFANNTSWRFVDATYRFPNPTNPWSAAFPEVVSVNDLVTNVRANFVAIKVGDVNASASVNSATSAEIRRSEDFKLKTQEQNLKVGNEYKVSFSAEDLKNIQGYQFALNLDQSKVELLDIEYGVAKAENFGLFKNEGIVTTSWNSKYEPGALFTLVLRAKADAKLSSTLSLNRLVHPEAYDQNNENLGIALNFEGIQATEAYELRQNTPNPFSDETVIGFTLPKALKGTLTVRDVKGALIYKVEGNYAKGNNQVTLKKSQLGASGVLYYTLETTDFTATKKMVILE